MKFIKPKKKKKKRRKKEEEEERRLPKTAIHQDNS